LPYGWLRAIDFHALPFRGEPLVASVAVEYALDLPAARPAIASGAALVVSDPTDDLPATRVEAAAVAVRLRDAGWSVVRVEGRDATSARVRQELPRAALFHYAGHGLFAGHDGIESALPLASGGSLTLGDIFALGATPSRVVLSGCDAARTTESDGAEGLGLAQAFVLAGADFVIAPWRKVDDASAATLSAALAKDLSRSADGAEVLRAAQNRLRAASDPSWAAFRVVAR
jgi:CHAT domain-containing protein